VRATRGRLYPVARHRSSALLSMTQFRASVHGPFLWGPRTSIAYYAGSSGRCAVFVYQSSGQLGPLDSRGSVGPYWRIRRGTRLMGRTGVERRGGWVALG
jgi:hypothetical protein